MSTHDATFYVQVKPTFFSMVGMEPRVRDIRATGLTQNRPQNPHGAVIVKLTLRIPDAAFMPLRPEAIVVVPENLTEVGAIEVEAADPREDGATS